MTTERLYDRLAAYAAGEMLPFHMPGHKRQTLDYLDGLSGRLDLTEIPGFDNLHAPQDCLRASMQLAAEVFGAYRTFYSVNGSTAGILSAIYALASPGSEVVIARNCHVSVYHAVELVGAVPIYLYPEFDAEFGIYTGITPKKAEQILSEHPNARLLVLTSPTYEGVISDVREICRVAHARGVRVVVDSAHGAHLGFGAQSPKSAVQCGADIVIQSLHKTLPSLTGTAVAHVASPALAERFSAALHIFQTTSPSYLLLASIDGCVHWLNAQGASALDARAESVMRLRRRIKSLGMPQLFDLPQNGNGFVLDRGKIFLSADSVGLNGNALCDLLRNAYHIEPEMATQAGVLLMTSPLDPSENDDALYRACKEISVRFGTRQVKKLYREPPVAERACAGNDPRLSQGRIIGAAEAVGKICCEYVCAYPPGSPLLAPGERITAEMADYMDNAISSGVELKHFISDDSTHFFAADI